MFFLDARNYIFFFLRLQSRYKAQISFVSLLCVLHTLSNNFTLVKHKKAKKKKKKSWYQVMQGGPLRIFSREIARRGLMAFKGCVCHCEGFTFLSSTTSSDSHNDPSHLVISNMFVIPTHRRACPGLRSNISDSIQTKARTLRLHAEVKSGRKCTCGQ